MLAGQSVDAFYASVAHAKPFAIGLNCATGPDLMTDHIRTLAQMAAMPVSCFPNAGLPNEDNQYLETPESLTAQLEKFVNQGWLNIVGGCCGTTPAHIRAIAQMAAGKPPRTIPASPHRAYYSGIELVEAEETLRPLIVGERTNVIGSRLFKNMIARREMGGSHRNRALAGEERRARHRRLPAILRPRGAEGHRPLLRDAHAQDQSAGDDRHHRSARDRGRARSGPKARASSTPSTSKTARRNSSVSALWPAPTAPRWSSEPSTRTSSRPRPSPASASSPSPSAPFNF